LVQENPGLNENQSAAVSSVWDLCLGYSSALMRLKKLIQFENKLDVIGLRLLRFSFFLGVNL
jgi:hypothetical protein